MLHIHPFDFANLASSEARTFYLYEIEWGDYDPDLGYYVDKDGEYATPLRYSNFDIPLEVWIWGNETKVWYHPAAIEHNEISQTAEGRLSDLTVSVGNADRIIQKYIEEYDMVGKYVNIHQVFFNPYNVENPASVIYSFKFMIKTVNASSTQADFVLSLGIDYLQLSFPSRKMFAHYCSWKFKDPTTCGYTGSDTNCTKTWDACKAKSNQRRFGGFPGIINERFYV